MNVNCPECRRPIPLDDVNVSKDIALCRGCGTTRSYSAILAGVQLEAGADLQNPPPGVIYRNDPMETVIGATHRSWGQAFGSLVFALFWNGIVSIFVLIAIMETLKRWGITAPDFVPLPTMKGDGVPFGSLVFLWLFLTPFILVGAFMIWALFSSLVGRTEIRIASGRVVVFTGIGPIGRRHRFDVGHVQDVHLDVAGSMNSNNAYRPCIGVELAGGRMIRFGTGLREDRRLFVAGALRKKLL